MRLYVSTRNRNKFGQKSSTCHDETTLKYVRVLKLPDLIKNKFIAAQNEYVRTQDNFCNICNIPNMFRMAMSGYKRCWRNAFVIICFLEKFVQNGKVRSCYYQRVGDSSQYIVNSQLHSVISGSGTYSSARRSEGAKRSSVCVAGCGRNRGGVQICSRPPDQYYACCGLSRTSQMDNILPEWQVESVPSIKT